MWSVGREDRAGRSRGRVPRPRERHDLGEVSDRSGDPAIDGVSRRQRRRRVVIWTTTPWTIPGNRAIAYSRRDRLGLYEVTGARRTTTGPRSASSYVLAESSPRTCSRPREGHGLDAQAGAVDRADVCERSSAPTRCALDRLSDFARAAARRRPRHRRRRHRLRPHRARPWPRGLRIWMAKHQARRARHRHAHPHHGRRRRLLHRRRRRSSRASASSTTRARRATPTRRSSRR